MNLRKGRLLLAVLIGSLANGAYGQVRNSDSDSGSSLNRTRNKASTLAIKYGVKAGVNISTMSNSMKFDPGFGAGVGFRVGAAANFHWGQRTSNSLPGTGWFGLQPELMYSYQSVKSDGGDIHFNYVQLPIMAKFYPLAPLSIEVGPEFNYLCATSPKYYETVDARIHIGECSGFNVGIGFGLAYEFDMGLTAGARYSLGFSDLGKNLKWKNNGNIQVTIGWFF